MMRWACGAIFCQGTGARKIGLWHRGGAASGQLVHDKRRLLDASHTHCCRRGDRCGHAAVCWTGGGRGQFFLRLSVGPGIDARRHPGCRVADLQEHGHDILDARGRLRARLPQSGQQRDLGGIFGRLAIGGRARFECDVQFQRKRSERAGNLQLPVAVADRDPVFRSHIDQRIGCGRRTAGEQRLLF